MALVRTISHFDGTEEAGEKAGSAFNSLRNNPQEHQVKERIVSDVVEAIAEFDNY